MLLKICTRDSVAWFPGFEDGLFNKFNFTIDRNNDLSLEDMVYSSFHKNYNRDKYGNLPPVIHILSFEEIGPYHNTADPPQRVVGHFLVGQRINHTYLEGWLFPVNSCYLLSESGKTVDKI